MSIHGIIHHRGLHGRRHHVRQRALALAMIASGLVRVAIWAALIILYVVGVHSIQHLYSSVAFVAILSVAALLLTDWGQVAASLAQFSAGAAHEDAEHTRQAVAGDVADVEADIARLAELQPGPEARELAKEIRQRLAA